MTKTWKIGYRFNDKTGEKRPWEVVNEAWENGSLIGRMQWSSFKTEEAAAKSIPASIKRMAGSETHGEIICENIGRLR
jgi:hypothetical protein